VSVSVSVSVCVGRRRPSEANELVTAELLRARYSLYSFD
jgi:hypothetical protein